MLKKSRLAVLACVSFTASAVRVSAAEAIDKPVSAAPIMSVQWHPSGKQVTYMRMNARSQALVSYDIEAAAEKVLFDPAAGGAGAPRLGLQGYVWSPKGDAILVKDGKDLWLIPIPGAQPRRLTNDEPDEESPAFSPDGKLIAFVKQNNLFVVDASNGAIRQLTSDGSETILNATLDWVYEEELRDANPSGRAYAWSPDSRQIAYLRLDQAKVPEHPIVDILQTHPTVTKQRYPKSGDANSTPAVCVVELGAENARTQRMALGAGVEYVMPELTWTPDSKTVAVTTLNRAQNELTVSAWSPSESADARVMFQEKDAAWINVFDAPRFLTGNAAPGKFIWLSERDGWMHAYLYGSDGKLTRQLTSGNWMIEPSISHRWSGMPYEIDAAQEWIYFSATEKDPRERHIYRTRLDGKGTLERLSKEDGTHFQKLSPNGNYLLESFSSDRQPPTTRLLRADGTFIATLHRSGNALEKAGSEYHELAAAEGTKLYARLTKPANFDAAKKYPVVVYVYGGPQHQVVRNSWGGGDGLDMRLSRDGCLIWSLDNRGSWGRGHAFETAIHKNMGAKELSDQLAGIEYLKKLPFVDGARVGIHGWSYGGYMTLYALTHAPDAFKCGAAGAPVTDWKYYDTIYTERYMSTPKENPEGYVSSSPLAAAGNLKAKLLLIHGTSDDNVHIQNTMNFLDALTKKGRPYELQIQPGQKHGFRGPAAGQYLGDRMFDFFKRNL